MHEESVHVFHSASEASVRAKQFFWAVSIPCSHECHVESMMGRQRKTLHEYSQRVSPKCYDSLSAPVAKENNMAEFCIFVNVCDFETILLTEY